MTESIYAKQFARVGLVRNGIRLNESLQVQIVRGADKPVIMHKESFITYENGNVRTTIAFDELGYGYEANDSLDLLTMGLQYAPALAHE